MSDDGWIAFAFLAGLSAAIVHFKTSRLGCVATLFALPFGLLVALGWPDGLFHEPFPALLVWLVFAFPGYAVGAAAVVLRIVR